MGNFEFKTSCVSVQICCFWLVAPFVVCPLARVELYRVARTITPNVVYLLPRNIDRLQVASLSRLPPYQFPYKPHSSTSDDHKHSTASSSSSSSSSSSPSSSTMNGHHNQDQLPPSATTPSSSSFASSPYYGLCELENSYYDGKLKMTAAYFGDLVHIPEETGEIIDLGDDDDDEHVKRLNSWLVVDTTNADQNQHLLYEQQQYDKIKQQLEEVDGKTSSTPRRNGGKPNAAATAVQPAPVAVTTKDIGGAKPQKQRSPKTEDIAPEEEDEEEEVVKGTGVKGAVAVEDEEDNDELDGAQNNDLQEEEE